MTERLRAVVAIAVVIGVVAAGAAALATHRSPTPAVASTTAATTPVVRADLAETTQLTGNLGFGAPVPVPLQGAAGTLTALPAPGAVVGAGRTLFEVDGAPVTLLPGTRPAWRDLSRGVPLGSDVRQLERDLVDLGYADRATLTVDDHFTWATSQAVRRWQRATHQPVTGAVALGRVAFLAAPVRVAAVQQPLGTAVQPGQPVLTVTATASIVTVDVPIAQAHLVHPGDLVSVTLPSGGARPGRVTTVSAVATDAGSTTGPGPQQSSGPQQPEVTADVTLTRPSSGVDATLDQAPVTVSVVDRQVRGVLAVPVTALVALAGGGYGVWADRPAPRHLVPVTPGLFAASLVEVHGTGLAEGDEVEVPSS